MHYCQTENEKFSPEILSHWGGGYSVLRPYPLGAFGPSITMPSALSIAVSFHLRLELKMTALNWCLFHRCLVEML